jgi:MFS family permease
VTTTSLDDGIATPSRPPKMTVREWGLLLVLCGALFLEGIDIAMLNVAVPAIAGDLGLSTDSAHWVISAYVLGYGGFMLLGGRAADLLGRRRVFLAALVVFVAFSGLGGLATESWMVVVARFATGVAAGFMTPAGLSIITTSFPEGPLRDRAVVIYGATGAAGFSLGMVAGGLLTTASWRWVFFAPVVLGAVLLVLGRALIRHDEPRSTAPARFDLVGALTVTGAMVAIVYGIVSVGEDGETTRVLVLAAAAALLLAAFVLHERRTPYPLVRLGILREGLVLSASGVGLLFMGSFFGFQLVGTLYLQDVKGWSPLETGLTFAIMGIDLVLAPVLTPRLVQRFGNGAVLVAGLAAATAAYALLLRLEDDWGYADLLPSLVLVGIAFTLAYGPVTLAAAEGVDETEQGLASGVLYTAFQFGGAIGLAVVSIVLSGNGGQDADDFRRAFLVPTVLGGLAAVAAALSVRRQH